MNVQVCEDGIIQHTEGDSTISIVGKCRTGDRNPCEAILIRVDRRVCLGQDPIGTVIECTTTDIQTTDRASSCHTQAGSGSIHCDSGKVQVCNRPTHKNSSRMGRHTDGCQIDVRRGPRKCQNRA